jgi:hypothetical protein
MRDQVISDFIVDHKIKVGRSINYVSVCSWKLYFDVSVCREKKGVDNVLVSPNNVIYETSCSVWNNNQTEYEILLFGLQNLLDMGV